MTKFQYNFYPRPPRGGRLGYQEAWADYRYISIHALREEGDSSRESFPEANARFLSTPSARRATTRFITYCTTTTNFYPRPPRGGRQSDYPDQRGKQRFLSTPSARRATYKIHHNGYYTSISIHALREEGDQTRKIIVDKQKTFLSTPSARRATAEALANRNFQENFYPRPPRGGRRLASKVYPQLLPYFYPRPPRGGRLCSVSSALGTLGFLSTPSARRATRRDTQRIPKHSFLSTPSARRATKTTLSCNSIWTISIHALREEGDLIALILA